MAAAAGSASHDDDDDDEGPSAAAAAAATGDLGMMGSRWSDGTIGGDAVRLIKGLVVRERASGQMDDW